MANEQNLIPLNKRSKDVQRAIQEKGRQANKKKWAEKKKFKELFTELLDDTATDIDGELITTRRAVVIKAMKFLTDKDADLDAREFIKVLEFIRDTVGEKPSEKVDLNIEDESARAIDDYFTEKYNRSSGE